PLLLLPQSLFLPGLHSRHVLDTVVSEPGLGLPWYSRVGYVDNQIIYIYTSEKQRVEPRPVWMAQNEGLEFWHERTCLDTLRELYNQSEGESTLDTADVVAGAVASAAATQRGSWLQSSGPQTKVQQSLQDLPFERTSLFSEQTDAKLHSLKDSRAEQKL
uniref:MHC class I-like antigen recognition-like domain-containing protein n=1 Tax=Gopherus agassizii TaxID=38772 RepID=A0A452HUG0_9SAUR